MIVVLNYENAPTHKIIFENTACVDFELNCTKSGNSYISTRLKLEAGRLFVGDGIEFENEWVF